MVAATRSSAEKPGAATAGWMRNTHQRTAAATARIAVSISAAVLR
jgi:hypothetical protein